MEIVELPYFPFPRLVEKRRIPGYDLTWTRQCEGCDRQCESAAGRDLSVCSYGVNYQRISDKQIVFGILVPGATATAAQKKVLKHNPEHRVLLRDLARAVSTLKELQTKFEGEIDSAKNQIIEDYKHQQEFKREILDQLRPEIEKNLAFLHDYKQFVARVKQNINVVLKTRYGAGETDQLLSKNLLKIAVATHLL